jgi:hypothetical protein
MLEREIHAVAGELLELGHANEIKISVAEKTVMDAQDNFSIRIIARKKKSSPATVCLQRS